MTFARWVDLGCPINTGEGTAHAAYGWFLDDVRPALALSSPQPGFNQAPLTVIRIGVSDAYTGLAPDSLSIKADFAVNGQPAGSELADLAVQSGEGIYTITLDAPLTQLTNAHLLVQVADQLGNITQVDRHFSVDATLPTPTPVPTAPPVTPSGEHHVFLPATPR